MRDDGVNELGCLNSIIKLFSCDLSDNRLFVTW